MPLLLCSLLTRTYWSATALLLLLTIGYGSRPAYAQRVDTIALKQDHFLGEKKIPMKASATVYTYAPGTTKGIHLVISIKNDSSNDVLLKNPLYRTNLHLLNSKGTDVVFPNLNFAVIYRTGHREVEEIPQAFTVNSVRLAGRALSQPEWSQATMLVPRHGVLELELTLDRVLRPNASKPYSFDQTENLPNGEYVFSISQTLQFYPVKNSALFHGRFIDLKITGQK